MALRKIITYPHPVLRQQAEPVTEFNSALQRLVDDMAATMYDAPGAGLAANQIGVLQQVVVIDISPPEEKDLVVLINPQLSELEGSVVGEEGCLSVLEYSAKVKRAYKLRCQARTVTGEPLDFKAEGWYARVLQHEVDHLHGVLYIDHISSLKRTLYKKKLKKMLKERS